jgi:pentapeptide MXKDX repeat protein
MTIRPFVAITGAVLFGLFLAAGSASAQTSTDTMKKNDTMKMDSMKTDSMKMSKGKSDCMHKAGMEKDSMKKSAMMKNCDAMK